MSGIDWQNIVALGLIGWAVAYLLTRVASVMRQRASACGGGCFGCPSSSAAKSSAAKGPTGSTDSLVSVEQLVKSAKRL